MLSRRHLSNVRRNGKTILEHGVFRLSVLRSLYFSQPSGAYYIEFRTHTNDRLDGIDTNLRLLLAAKEPKKVALELALLPPQELSKNLSALKVLSEQSPTALGISNNDLTRIAAPMGDWEILSIIKFSS